MILSNKWTTKALIRLRECAGWSAPLFASHWRQIFSRWVWPICVFCQRKQLLSYPLFLRILYAKCDMNIWSHMSASFVMSNCSSAHYLQHLLAQLIHYIPPYLSTVWICMSFWSCVARKQWCLWNDISALLIFILFHLYPWIHKVFTYKRN